MPDKCRFPDDAAIRPDGVNDLDPCRYETIDEAVTPKYGFQFRVLKCVNCGHVEIEWARPGAVF